MSGLQKYILQVKAKLSSPSVIQFIKFGLVGVSNTVISLSIYYLFIWISRDLYLVGKTAGWIVSVANAFYWNNKCVFSSDGSDAQTTLKKIVKTYLSYGGTFLLGIGLLYIEVDVLGLSVTLCPLINLLVSIPLNYILNKYWTFRQPKSDVPKP